MDMRSAPSWRGLGLAASGAAAFACSRRVWRRRRRRAPPTSRWSASRRRSIRWRRPPTWSALIMQHVYEPLYTFDANWDVQPMLAESMPKISADGKIYTIPLRKGVKLHNGTRSDVRRRRRVAEALDGDGAARQGGRPRSIKSHRAPRARPRSRSRSERPYAPLLAHLALPSGFAGDHGQGNRSPRR